jgi:hypothetical protein
VCVFVRLLRNITILRSTAPARVPESPLHRTVYVRMHVDAASSMYVCACAILVCDRLSSHRRVGGCVECAIFPATPRAMGAAPSAHVRARTLAHTPRRRWARTNMRDTTRRRLAIVQSTHTHTRGEEARRHLRAPCANRFVTSSLTRAVRLLMHSCMLIDYLSLRVQACLVCWCVASVCGVGGAPIREAQGALTPTHEAARTDALLEVATRDLLGGSARTLDSLRADATSYLQRHGVALGALDGKPGGGGGMSPSSVMKGADQVVKGFNEVKNALDEGYNTKSDPTSAFSPASTDASGPYMLPSDWRGGCCDDNAQHIANPQKYVASVDHNEMEFILIKAAFEHRCVGDLMLSAMFPGSPEALKCERDNDSYNRWKREGGEDRNAAYRKANNGAEPPPGGAPAIPAAAPAAPAAPPREAFNVNSIMPVARPGGIQITPDATADLRALGAQYGAAIKLQALRGGRGGQRPAPKPAANGFLPPNMRDPRKFEANMPANMQKLKATLKANMARVKAMPARVRGMRNGGARPVSGTTRGGRAGKSASGNAFTRGVARVKDRFGNKAASRGASKPTRGGRNPSAATRVKGAFNSAASRMRKGLPAASSKVKGVFNAATSRVRNGAQAKKGGGGGGRGAVAKAKGVFHSAVSRVKSNGASQRGGAPRTVGAAKNTFVAAAKRVAAPQAAKSAWNAWKAPPPAAKAAPPAWKPAAQPQMQALSAAVKAAAEKNAAILAAAMKKKFGKKL